MIHRKRRSDIMSKEYLLSKLEEACVLKGRSIKARELRKLIGFPGKTRYEVIFGGIQKALCLIGRVPVFPNPDRIRGTKTPLKMRFKILERDNFTCQYCGATPKSGAILMIDHIIPSSKGGETIPENLVTACFFCNIGKRDAILEFLSKNKKATNGS